MPDMRPQKQGAPLPSGAKVRRGRRPPKISKAVGLSLEQVDGGDAPPSRHLRLLAAVGAEREEDDPAASAAESRAQRFALSRSALLSGGTVDDAFADVKKLCLDQQRRPAVDVIEDFARAQEDVYALLEQRQRPSEARTLYLLAGVVGGLLSKVSQDLTHYQAAATQAHAAFVAAEMAGHDGLRAWVRGQQALVAYWDGRYGDSVEYAQDGQRYPGRGTASRWLPAAEARAWGALGNVEQMKAATLRAEKAWERAGTDELDQLGGVCSFARSRHLYYVAEAHAWLAELTTEALGRAEAAVEAYRDPHAPGWAFADAGPAQAALATIRVRLGDLDGAYAALEPVLSLPVSMRVSSTARGLDRVRRAITHAGLGGPQAAHFTEELEDFSRTVLAG